MRLETRALLVAVPSGAVTLFVYVLFVAGKQGQSYLFTASHGDPVMKVKGFSIAAAHSRVADGEASAQITLIQGAQWGSHLVLCKAGPRYLLICLPAHLQAWPCSAELRCYTVSSYRKNSHPPAVARGRAPPRADLTLEVDVGIEEQGAVWADRCQGSAHVPPCH